MSLPLALSLPSLSLDDTYGALLVGSFIGFILYGLSLHQLFRYIRLFPSDVLSIRLLVSSVMALETFHVVVTFYVCYHYLVTSYFMPLVLLEGVWTLQIIPALTAFTACLSKAFLARRVFLTGPRARWAVGIVAILLVAELTLAIVLTAKGFILKSLIEYTHSTVGILTACEAAATAADALLAGTLIVSLWAQGYYRRRSGSFIEDYVMTYVVKSGLLTAICNLIALIMAQVWKQAFLYAAVNIITARFYANTLFAVLNSRQLMANGRLEVFANADNTNFNAIAQVNRIVQAERWNAPYRAKSPPATIRVNVTAERERYAADTNREGSMAYDRKSLSLPV